MRRGSAYVQASDHALMVRYGEGDSAAFDELYWRYERRIYGFCLRTLKDPDRAADAFQEVFRRVVDARESYEPRARFASWIFTITRRVCIDSLRATRSEQSLDALEPVPAAAGGPELAARVARVDELQRLLALLPQEQTEALLLSKYYGFSYGEIAEMIGSTEAAVKQKVYRALQTLRGAVGSAG